MAVEIGRTHTTSFFVCYLFVTPEQNITTINGLKLLIFRGFRMERATGVEPASKAWEAFILPMNYARKSARLWQAQNHSVPRILEQVKRDIQ